MASASSARFQGFHLASDGTSCFYSDFNGQGGINDTHVAEGDFHKSRMARSSFVPDSVYSQPADTISQEVINALEMIMKKNSDNLLRFLEGISSRLSQIEFYCYNVDKSVGEMRSELVHRHMEVNAKLNTLEENIGEVQRCVQILRGKQEIAETHKSLARLHLAQKESLNSIHSKHIEERPPTYALEPQEVSDSCHSSNDLNQKLTRQILPSKQSHSPRTANPSRLGVPPASTQWQHQNIPHQQQGYVLPPTQVPPQSSQGQGQYVTTDSQYSLPQMQDMHRESHQPVQLNINTVLPPSTIHHFPQYLQQWPQQTQQQLQPQRLQQPPKVAHIRTQSGPAYPSYQPSQPDSSVPPDTFPGSKTMQRPFSDVPQSGKSRADATVLYGYAGQPVQQQPPTQQLSENFGTPPINGYTNTGSHTSYIPSSGYIIYGDEKEKPLLPSQQPHFSQGTYPPTPHNQMTRNPSQTQFVQRQPYSDLIQKLVKVGFRGDYASNVIQMMEDSGQPINFNSVLDRIGAQSS